MPIESLELQSIGSNVISGELPCGVSVRYEPDFQKLEAQIAKLESIAGEQVDWQVVLDLSILILKTQSKDILVAVYFTQALLKVYGISGLSIGLSAIKDMVDTHWSDMLPPVKRIRARSSALQWLSEQADYTLSTMTVDAQNAKHFLSSSLSFIDLMDVLESKYDGESPSMLELHKRLKESKREAKQFVSEEQVAEPVPTKTQETAQQTTQKITPVVSNPDVQETIAVISAENKTATPNSLVAESNPENEEKLSILSGHEYEHLGSINISDESPCGIAAKYETDFEALEAELAKQESVTAATVDWRDVCQYGVNLLTNQTKDLLVSAYLAKGLVETQGYFGLTLSLKIVRDIISTHWVSMYPPLKRMRAREAALNWLSEKTGHFALQNKPKTTDYAAILESYDLLYEIMDLLDQKIEGGGPSLLEISKPLKDYRKEAKYHFESLQQAAVKKEKTPQKKADLKDVEVKKEEEPEPIKQNIIKKASPASKKALTTVNTGPVTSDNEAKKTIRSIQEAARTAGGFYLDQQKFNAKAYRLNRVSTWLMIDQAPPAKDGVTQLPSSPVADKRKQLETLFEANKFEELLPQLEQTLTRAPFWLDGQLLAAKSLQVLGDKFQDAYECVIRETRNFLERAPGIEYLKFSDNVPFANEQTLLWISSEVMSSNDTGESQGETPWQECFEQAKVLMASKKTAEALELFNQGINSTTSLRLNWQWRFALAQLLEQSGKLKQAVPILKSLIQELEKDDLLKWDSLLCQKVALTLYNCSDKLFSNNKKDLTMLDIRQYAYQILCLVDPITSIKLQEG
ncbi:MAG: type VI secretion system protein TssA [Saccharospirillaceae bacterium]|nr:type VI secretion system protein TssA [Pseudomonadales bacterium]NRB81230.1 type VI secretion system protein TssA [Saccharospirillaceae bacterium]